MRKLLAVLFISIMFVGCSSSKKCGCPNWGMNDSVDAKTQIVQVQITEDGWLWN